MSSKQEYCKLGDVLVHFEVALVVQIGSTHCQNVTNHTKLVHITLVGLHKPVIVLISEIHFIIIINEI